MVKIQFKILNIIAISMMMLSVLVMPQMVFSQSYTVHKSQTVKKVGAKSYFLHKVVKGNTLFNIAQAYGVPKSKIEAANPNLRGSNMRVGQQLLIPVLSQKDRQASVVYHIVKQGETLYSIAKAYQLSVDEIRSRNGLKSDNLSVGQYIKVLQWSGDQGVVPTTAKNSVVANMPQQGQYHIVKPKENLYAISKQWGVSVRAIMQANKLKSHHIRAYDTLRIPLEAGATVGPSLQDKPFVTHYVRASETLYSIARYYAISVSEIKKYNQLADNNIYEGKRLKIPRKLNDKSYIEHRVSKRREKMSDIAREYLVPLHKLKARNPQLGNKVRRGTVVQVPLPYVESSLANDSEEVLSPQPNEEEVLVEEHATSAVGVGACEPLGYQQRKYKIALLMPLELDKLQTTDWGDSAALLRQKKHLPYKFIQFYEGALLAAQDMAAQGLDFEWKVVDVPRKHPNVPQLLQSASLNDADLIISLLYTDGFAPVASFAKQHHIPLVNAVSKRRKILYKQPQVYKVQSDEAALYDRVLHFVADKHANDNIIIVRSNPYELSKDYSKFVKALQQKMSMPISVNNAEMLAKIKQWEAMGGEQQRTSDENSYSAYRIWKLFAMQHANVDVHRLQNHAEASTKFNKRVHTVVFSEAGLEGIVKAANPFVNNLIVAIGNKEVFAIDLFTKLNYVKKHLDMQVVGLPFWGDFDNLDVEHTQALQLHVLASHYIDYSKPEVKLFVHRFRQAYNTEPLPQRYAFLGYDISLYFMTALKAYGANFEDCLPALQQPLLERTMRFEKTPLGGYENKYWYILKQTHYKRKPVY